MRYIQNHLTAIIRVIGVALGMLVPFSAYAFQMNPCWAGVFCDGPATLFVNFNNAFFFAGGLIAVTIFLVGAFMMVISAGQDTMLQAGKRAMKGSLIGLALIAGSYGIYRTVVWWLYP